MKFNSVLMNLLNVLCTVVLEQYMGHLSVSFFPMKVRVRHGENRKGSPLTA